MSGERHASVVVAVRAVRVVQVAVHEEVDVVAVRHGLMTARRTMHVRRIVCAACMGWSAGRRIGGGDLERVLVDVTVMQVMQMAVVQVIDVAVVDDSLMATAGAVLVGVICVDTMGLGHDDAPQGLRGLPPLRGVVDRRPHDGQHMVVVKGVGDVPAVAAPGDEPLVAQHANPLRDGRQALAFRLSEIRHAGRRRRQPRQQPQPALVAKGTQEPRGPLQSGR